MSFFAVLFALLLEQVKPLPRGNVIHDALTAWMQWTARNFDAGRESHAWVVWCVTALAPALLTWGVFFALDQASSVLGLVFDVAVLYLTLGFRQFSHYFTDIRKALDHGDEIEARRLLSEWRHVDASELPRLGAAAPRDRAFAAGRPSPRLRRLLLVRAALDLRPRPGRGGALPHGRARQPLLVVQERRWRDRRQRDPDAAVAAPVPPARPACRRASPPRASPSSATSRRR